MGTPEYQGKHNKLFSQKMSTNSFLTIYILHVLNEKCEWMYGREIISKIESRFNGTFKPSHGLVYPLLRDLEKAGCLEAHWEDGDSKKTRRFYRITETGRSTFELEAKNFKPIFMQTYFFYNNILRDLYQKEAK